MEDATAAVAVEGDVTLISRVTQNRIGVLLASTELRV
jgi:hypothetical protein